MDPVNQYTDIELLTSSSALRARLAEIGSEIEELYTRIAYLKTARISVANALGAIVYPILTLPVELTAEIFAHYFNEVLSEVDGLPLCNLRTARDDGPLILSQVCRAWRTIAINTPSLWCRVRASFRDPGRPECRKLLESWLSRAGNRMLYIDLATSPRHFTNLFPAVVPYSSQWRILKFCIGCDDDWTSMSPLVDTVRGRIPLLHEFGVWLERPSNLTTTPITAFYDAPELRKVTLQYLRSEIIALPWAQLTHLTLYGQTVQEAFEILRQTPERLEELSLDVYGDGSESLNPVNLGHVHRLLLPNDFDYIPETLSCITLPKLRLLEIGQIFKEEDADALLTFAKRSHCTLETVSVPGDAEQHLTMYTLESEAIATASHVSVPDIDWSVAELEQFFSWIGSDSAFLPNMRSLHLPRCETEVPFAALADMLSSRSYNRAGQPRFESFRLSQMYHQNPDHAIAPAIAEQLRALMDDGLDIHIESLNGMGYTEKFSR
ncbi:F-box domain-containing protein [Favolaschia claudopus]|uniref:F-box domain-containing protein n=1 Tax=Favolaschia claudopus TaxID=2862362 RepID=A0AAW0BIG4_9AGAR